MVADPGGAADMLYDPERKTRPTYALIAPGREVVSVGSTVEEADIEAILPG